MSLGEVFSQAKILDSISFVSLLLFCSKEQAPGHAESAGNTATTGLAESWPRTKRNLILNSSHSISKLSHSLL